MEVLPEHEALRAAYKKAEDAIHELGIEVDGADLAAVNELRYAGNHILRSLTTTDSAKRSEELDKAQRHCERAVYDAYDSAIYFHLSRFNQFRDRYADMVIGDVLPNYIELSKSMTQAKRLLTDARTNSNRRGDYYDRVKEIYPQIVDITDTLDAARDELNKKRIERKDSRVRTAVVATVTAILGAAIGAAVKAWLS